VIWLVVVEAVAICVLGLVVVALAHSYAGLAARVEQPGTPARTPPSVELTELELVGAPDGTAPPLRDLDGVTPGGERVLLPLAGAVSDTLLAFLSSSCASCRALWDGMPAAATADLFDEVRLVVVSKGPDRESPSMMADLAARAGGADVVMSSQVWLDVHVPGSPYFALVSRRTGEILGQGTARTWDQVAGLIAVAGGDERHGRRTRKSRRDRRQELDVDRVLLDAGVAPGDPSLYPIPDGAGARVDRARYDGTPSRELG
jgi:hypothetical protein